MGNKKSKIADASDPSLTRHETEKNGYRPVLHALQIELVKLQKHFIRCDDKILVLLEGRDAAGKYGVIKRSVRHLSPRESRVVALGKPSDREHGRWYFQRNVPHLPAEQEFVLFNLGWYNRAGVERVMEFFSDQGYEEFMHTAPEFEHMLVRSGINLFKYYLDISRPEQTQRLKDRREDPLKQWKISPIDAKAVDKWTSYSSARNEMFARTHNSIAPWTFVRADDKRLARVNLIKNLLMRLHYDDKDEAALLIDPDIIFPYSDAHVQNGAIPP